MIISRYSYIKIIVKYEEEEIYIVNISISYLIILWKQSSHFKKDWISYVLIFRVVVLTTFSLSTSASNVIQSKSHI
jgi:hypothetical protein